MQAERTHVPSNPFGVGNDAATLGPMAAGHADIDIDDARWHIAALCAQVDPEAFFPEKGGSTRDAKRICTACDVKAHCLLYALVHDERFGIWGSFSERERRRIKRRRDGSFEMPHGFDVAAEMPAIEATITSLADARADQGDGNLGAVA